MKLSLVVVTAGKAAGQVIPIKTPQFVIGRDPQCNLRPGSAMISKKHCAVVIKGEQVFLHDFGSTNGTFLNDQPVKGDVELKNDDVLKVGPLTFKVALEAGQPAPSKPTPPPKPASKNAEEDEAAALLLSLEAGSIAPQTSENESDVPGGSTVMDIPSFAGPPGADGMPAKPGEKKKEEKPKQHDSASSAAAALIDKMRKGVRK
jgi:pSer/pThr/pTyr-binding forkhead associated (FHA) protein